MSCKEPHAVRCAGLQAKIRDIIGKEAGGAIREPAWDYDSIERVRDSFQDEASRRQYEQEIVYLALRESGINNAAKYSPCGNRQWQSATLLTKILLDGFDFQRLDGWRMPKLDVPAGSQELEFYFQLTTFVLEQYRYGDDVRVRNGDVVLDCGACVGDTAIWALSCGAASVHCFEPDELNIAALENNAARHGDGRIAIAPCAVGKETGMARFVHDHGNCGASRIADASTAGSATVPMTRIDDYVREHGVAPSFVKMDLEGGETDALEGARETLANHRPQLAICLYHRPSDMWTIPDLISATVPEYRFWCRKNNPVCEFVLYGAV